MRSDPTADGSMPTMTGRLQAWRRRLVGAARFMYWWWSHDPGEARAERANAGRVIKGPWPGQRRGRIAAAIDGVVFGCFLFAVVAPLTDPATRSLLRRHPVLTVLSAGLYAYLTYEVGVKEILLGRRGPRPRPPNRW